MDKLTNVVSGVTGAASRALYGDKNETDTTQRQSGTEPPSGVTGPGKPTKPYDGGNAEENQRSAGLGASNDRTGESSAGTTDPHTSNLTERRLDPGPVETGQNTTSTSADDRPSGTDSRMDTDTGLLSTGNTRGSNDPTDQASGTDTRTDTGLLGTGDARGSTDPTDQPYLGGTRQDSGIDMPETGQTTGSTFSTGQGIAEDRPMGSGLGMADTGNTTGSSDPTEQKSMDDSRAESGRFDTGDTTGSSYPTGQQSTDDSRMDSGRFDTGNATGSSFVTGQQSTDDTRMGSGLSGIGDTTSSSYPTGLSAEDRPMGSGSLGTGDNVGSGSLGIGDNVGSSYSSGQPSGGDIAGSSGAAGYSTFSASKLDPRSGGSGEDSTTLGTGSSYTTGDQPTLSGASYDTPTPRITSDDRGDDYDRPESTMTGDTSMRRAHGQYDTETAPSGGIAQGGQPQGINVAGMIRPEHDHDRTGVKSFHSDDAKAEVLHPSSADEPSIAGGGQNRAPVGGFGVVEPSVGGDPSSGQKLYEPHHGSERPHEAPGEEGTEAIREKKEAAERTLLSVDDDGLEEYPRDRMSQHRPSMPGDPLGTTRERGTGVKQVKSTGLAADGGDFDAAAPGAGREADRLLEQQGIQRTPAPGEKHGHHTTGEGEKHGIGEKIKEKLHLGKH